MLFNLPDSVVGTLAYEDFFVSGFLNAICLTICYCDQSMLVLHHSFPGDILLCAKKRDNNLSDAPLNKFSCSLKQHDELGTYLHRSDMYLRIPCI